MLRDHTRMVGQTLEFRPDGIRFERLTPQDLAGRQFGLHGNVANLRVLCGGRRLAHTLKEMSAGVHHLTLTEG